MLHRCAFLGPWRAPILAIFVGLVSPARSRLSMPPYPGLAVISGRGRWNQRLGFARAVTLVQVDIIAPIAFAVGHDGLLKWVVGMVKAKALVGRTQSCHWRSLLRVASLPGRVKPSSRSVQNRLCRSLALDKGFPGFLGQLGSRHLQNGRNTSSIKTRSNSDRFHGSPVFALHHQKDIRRAGWLAVHGADQTGLSMSSTSRAARL